MTTIKFTPALSRFFPELKPLQIAGHTVFELLEKIETHHPGIKSYLVDEGGRLRKHVNIYIDNTLITDRDNLSDSVSATSEVYIMQALSGG